MTNNETYINDTGHINNWALHYNTHDWLSNGSLQLGWNDPDVINKGVKAAIFIIFYDGAYLLTFSLLVAPAYTGKAL